MLLKRYQAEALLHIKQQGFFAWWERMVGHGHWRHEIKGADKKSRTIQKGIPITH